MAALPANPVATISPAEMQILVSRAGLVLNPGQVADLVLAWRQVAGLIASIPHGRPLADDFAFAFRLPSPASSHGAEPPGEPAKTRRAAPAKRKAAPPKRKAAAPAKPKPATKRPAASKKAKPRGAAKAGNRTRGRR